MLARTGRDDFEVLQTVVHEMMHLLEGFPKVYSIETASDAVVDLCMSQESTSVGMAGDFDTCPDKGFASDDRFTGEVLADLATLVLKARFSPDAAEQIASQRLLQRVLTEEAFLADVYARVFV
jgi:hypothetical protein